MSAMHKRLEQLLFTSACEPFSETERSELNALLRDNADARAFAAQFLTIDSLLSETLAASEHTTMFQPIPISAGRPISRPNWFARAAAWIGAFHLFSNTAKATSTTILMKKTVTSITAAILVLGGSGIYAIHHHNESSRDRMANMETEIQSLSDQLGIKTTRSPNRRAGTTNAPKTVSIVQVLAIYDGDNRISMQEKATLDQFKKQLAAMDAESLKSLLLDAEKISNPIQGRVAEMIMAELILKDPAEATQVACQLNGRGPEFQFLLSLSAAKAFTAWLEKDPAAADAWYVATAAAGGLTSKNIAPNGLEELAIDRNFARLRFAAKVKTNPAEAASMLATMLPADVTKALQEVTDPDALRQILPKLAPAQQGPAAEGAIKAMAAADLNAAFTWAKSLEMDDQARDALMATGIEAAVASGKLDLAGVSERAKDLNLDAARRSDLLVSAATDVSSILQEKEHHIDSENRVVWDRVAERIDWLRKEAPAAMSEKMVGNYLGKLSYESHNLDKSLEAYQNEVNRQGRIDPDLTIAFAFYLQLQESDGAKAAALDLLTKLPPSAKRDNAIQNTELNR
jgi:hypothetical protein